MKSYTDLEQSKKLAKILPLESADMIYMPMMDIDSMSNSGFFSIPECYPFNEFKDSDTKPLPCWSLAALLSILPPYLFEFERGIDLNVYPNLNGKGWHCSYMPNCIENMEKDKFKLITSEDSPVDACVEMIIKLKELNLL